MPQMEKGGRRKAGTTPDLQFPAEELERGREGRRVKLEAVFRMMTTMWMVDGRADIRACNFIFLSLLSSSFLGLYPVSSSPCPPFGSLPQDEADGSKRVSDERRRAETSVDDQHRLQTNCNPKQADWHQSTSHLHPPRHGEMPGRSSPPRPDRGPAPAFLSSFHRQSQLGTGVDCGECGEARRKERETEEEKDTGNRRQASLMEVDNCLQAVLTLALGLVTSSEPAAVPLQGVDMALADGACSTDKQRPPLSVSCTRRCHLPARYPCPRWHRPRLLRRRRRSSS